MAKVERHQYPARVAAVQIDCWEPGDELPLISTLGLQLDGNPRLSFEPGQFLMVGVPGINDQKGRPIRRAFSIASSLQDELIEIGVKRVDGGAISPALVRLEVGDELWVEGPYGHPWLKKMGGREKVFVAGGIGITPIRCMLRTLAQGTRDGQVSLFYGARLPSQFAYAPEFLEYARQGWLRLVQAVDRPSPPDWQGAVGYIHEVLSAEGISGQGKTAFVCGPPVMVKASVASLLSLGFEKQAVLKEEWG